MLDSSEKPGSLHPLDENTLFAVLEQFPYKLNVTSVDGVMVYANSRFMEGVLEHARQSAVGQYNVLQDPEIEAWGIKDHVIRAFAGEVVTTRGVKFPNKELIGIRYGKEQAFQNLFQDITSFPLRDSEGCLTHVVTYFVPVDITLRHGAVMAAKTYIELHWMEPLSTMVIARAARLSASRLAELFHVETGFTLHDYYLDTKMRNLCDCLLHPDISVQEAFEMAGISYNSHYTRLFRKHTGVSPREFRAKRKKPAYLPPH